jgi:hypothetical protein
MQRARRAVPVPLRPCGVLLELSRPPERCRHSHSCDAPDDSLDSSNHGRTARRDARHTLALRADAQPCRLGESTSSQPRQLWGCPRPRHTPHRPLVNRVVELREEALREAGLPAPEDALLKSAKPWKCSCRINSHLRRQGHRRLIAWLQSLGPAAVLLRILAFWMIMSDARRETRLNGGDGMEWASAYMDESRRRDARFGTTSGGVEQGSSAILLHTLPMSDQRDYNATVSRGHRKPLKNP